LCKSSRRIRVRDRRQGGANHPDGRRIQRRGLLWGILEEGRFIISRKTKETAPAGKVKRIHT